MKVLIMFMGLVGLVGCEGMEKERPAPPPQPTLIPYKIIVPFSGSGSDRTSTVMIHARLCKPLYYDSALIHVHCFGDGEWVWKSDKWKYVGKTVAFDGVVKAYYPVQSPG